MSSYRFCRTDDIPLLVEAYNVCYRPHFQELPELTVPAFKRLIREQNLWCSSCMVAADEAKRPIGVLLAAKRESANLIWAVGVHPDHLRRGHGRHLMSSLSAKLAILGPPRMLAEVPAEWKQARAFVEACGYRGERSYDDRERPAALSEAPTGGELLVPITVDELIDHGAFEEETHRCWARAPRTLLNLKGEIRGKAVASDRIEAWLLYVDIEDRVGVDPIAAVENPGPTCGREMLACGGRVALIELLLRQAVAEARGAVRIRKAGAGEFPETTLARLGFQRRREYVGYVADATA